MIRALTALALVAGLAIPAFGQSYKESPSLIEDVKAGKLPAIAQRLPAEPRVVDFDALGIKPG